MITLIKSARMNGHDPYAYLKDVLRRLPTQLIAAASVDTGLTYAR